MRLGTYGQRRTSAIAFGWPVRHCPAATGSTNRFPSSFSWFSFNYSTPGLAFIRQSTVLFNLARELIPTHLQSTVVLPRRRASLLFEKRWTRSNGPSLGLTYLGLSEG